MVLVVYPPDEFSNWRDTEEIVGVGEEAHPCNDDGFEVVVLSSCGVKGRKDF